MDRRTQRKVDVFVKEIKENSVIIRFSILNKENEYLYVFPDVEVPVGTGQMVGDIFNPIDPRDTEPVVIDSTAIDREN